MKFSRASIAFLAIASLQLAPFVPALAGGLFDGTFMYKANGIVEYFSLSETASQVAGFVYTVNSDPTVPGGFKESRINVSGVTDGSQVNFREGQGAFSSTLGWIARAGGNGFSMSYPGNGGYLATRNYQRVSPDDVNGAISYLHQAVGRAQAQQAIVNQRVAVQNELADATIRLQQNESARISISLIL
jgi:hypothetical protein